MQQVLTYGALVAVGFVVTTAVCIAALARTHVPVRVLLGGYAFVVPLGPSFAFSGLPDGFDTPSSLVGGAVILALLPHALIRGRSMPPPPASLPWIAFAGWAALTATWSADVTVTMSLLVALLSSAALYALAVHADFDRRDLTWMAIGSAAGGIAQSLQALWAAVASRIQPTSGVVERFSPEGGDPNHTAAALLLPLALTVCWSTDAPSAGRRAAARCSALLFVCAILLTGSRGGLIGVIVVLVTVAVLGTPVARRRLGVTLLALVVAGVATFSIAPPQVQQRFAEPNSTGRTQIWQVGWASCRDGCWWGDGWGTYGYAYRQTWLEDLSLVGRGDSPWASHNIVLGSLVEAGLLGLLLLCVASWLLLRTLRRLPHGVRSAPFTAVLALLVSGMFVASLSYKYFWLSLLFAVAAIKVHGQREDRSPVGEGAQLIVSTPLHALRQEDP